MTALRSFVDELGIFFEGRRVTCIVECCFRLVNRGIDWMKELQCQTLDASPRTDSFDAPALPRRSDTTWKRDERTDSQAWPPSLERGRVDERGI